MAVLLSGPHCWDPETSLGRAPKEEPGFLGESPKENYLDQESGF